MLNKFLLLPAAAVAMFGLVACGGDDDDPTATNTPGGFGQTTTPGSGTPGTGDAVTVELEAAGNNGVDGMAVLAKSADGMNTSVTVTLNDATAVGVAAIHAGSCDDWDDTAVATIGNVSAGMATGAVNVSLDTIESDDHVVVVVPAAGGDPISCGQV